MTQGTASSDKRCRKMIWFTLTPSSMKRRGVFRSSDITPAQLITLAGFYLLGLMTWSMGMSVIFLPKTRKFYLSWMACMTNIFSSVRRVGGSLPSVSLEHLDNGSGLVPSLVSCQNGAAFPLPRGHSGAKMSSKENCASRFS